MSTDDTMSAEGRRDSVHPEGEEPPPPGVHTMALVRWAILAATLVVAFLSFWFLLAPRGASNVKWTCPMVEHAFVIMDEPGECPICHMTLVPMEASLAEARKKHEAPQAAGSSNVPGAAPIALELDRVQRIGVRTSIVGESDTATALRAPASVEAPEQGESQVHVRSPGFVEKILVSQTGGRVGAGQPLLYVYSPEIYRAEEELLTARKFAEAGGGVLSGGPTVDASRRRVELLGLSKKDIDDVVAKGAPERLTAIRAPAGGSVLKKDVALGAYVTPEMTLYSIVDLAHVWAIAELYAGDVQLVHVGDVGKLHFPALGEHEIEAKVDLIYPEMNAAARTTRVRLRVDNKKNALRPGLYGEVIFPSVARRSLSVPRDAVVDTGEVKYVFVDEGEGHYVPRRVVTGPENREQIEILDGLRAGEKVVSGATFLVDAESRLEAALTGPPATSSSAAPSTAPSVAPEPARSAVLPPPHTHEGRPPAIALSAPPPASSAPPPPAKPSAAASTPAPVVYTCPMHPEVRSPTPGNCSKCGMTLVPVR